MSVFLPINSAQPLLQRAMNLGLNPASFHRPFPEHVEASLAEHGIVLVKFNRRGNLLAGGCTDGRCVIWDFDTINACRVLIAHAKAITSLSWSRSGRNIATASSDGSCILWDVLDGAILHKLTFDTPLTQVAIHPREENVLLLGFCSEQPLVINWRTDERWSVSIPTSAYSKGLSGNSSESIDSELLPDNPLLYADVVAVWDPKGIWIYLGTIRQGLTIISYNTKKVVYSSIETCGAVRQLSFSRDGRDMITLSTDKILRYFTIPEETRKPRPTGNGNVEVFEPPILIHEFQDPVTRIGWKACSFNATGKYVIGGAEFKTDTHFYIWDKEMGVLSKILEGPKEGLETFVWHPYRPVIVSVTAYFTINIWSNTPTEKWSAFAPDFRELEENVEYDEREDEFDIYDEPSTTSETIDNAIQPPRKNGISTAAPAIVQTVVDDSNNDIEENTVIDVFTIEDVNPFGDSDSELELDHTCKLWNWVLPLRLELDEEVPEEPFPPDEGTATNEDATTPQSQDTKSTVLITPKLIENDTMVPNGRMEEINDYMRERDALSTVTLEIDENMARKRVRTEPEESDGVLQDDVEAKRQKI